MKSRAVEALNGALVSLMPCNPRILHVFVGDEDGVDTVIASLDKARAQMLVEGLLAFINGERDPGDLARGEGERP